MVGILRGDTGSGKRLTTPIYRTLVAVEIKEASHVAF